jgi:hypothetical protein
MQKSQSAYKKGHPKTLSTNFAKWVKSGLLMIVSIYAKVSIMQFETPTSSLKAITNNLTRAANNIYKSLVIILFHQLDNFIKHSHSLCYDCISYNHQVGKTCHFANHPYLCKSLNQLIKKDTQKPSAQINQSA